MKLRTAIITGLICLYALLSVEAWAQYNPQYKKQISFTNDSSVSFSNYQAFFRVNTQALIGSGFMQPDGDDIRFSPNSCSPVSFYDYWIENYINTDSTKIWVKLPSFPSMSTTSIYM
ncbi:MAG TPA: DUF2341 domain-containing protein, partial [Bacteroidia bacterium]|nr:DUF2341 domain-containing protein [Bacteroidia bacterium]